MTLGGAAKCRVEGGLLLYLVVLAAGAEAKDEQVSVGVGGGKVLPIWTTFAVKQCSVPLALNLSTHRERVEGGGRKVHTVNHNITPPRGILSNRGNCFTAYLKYLAHEINCSVQ